MAGLQQDLITRNEPWGPEGGDLGKLGRRQGGEDPFPPFGRKAVLKNPFEYLQVAHDWSVKQSKDACPSQVRAGREGSQDPRKEMVT